MVVVPARIKDPLSSCVLFSVPAFFFVLFSRLHVEVHFRYDPFSTISTNFEVFIFFVMAFERIEN